MKALKGALRQRQDPFMSGGAGDGAGGWRRGGPPLHHLGTALLVQRRVPVPSEQGQCWQRGYSASPAPDPQQLFLLSGTNPLQSKCSP